MNGFYGSDCSLNQNNYLKLIKIRELLCVSMNNLNSLQDATTDVIYSRAISVISLTTDSTQISTNAFNNCSQIIFDNIQSNSLLVGSNSNSFEYVTAISNILAIKRLSLNKTDFLTQIIESVDSLTTKIHSQQAIHETSQQIITQNLRLNVYLTVLNNNNNSNSNSNSLTTLAIPMNSYETYNYMNVSSTIIQSNSNKSVNNLNNNDIIGVTLSHYPFLDLNNSKSQNIALNFHNYNISLLGNLQISNNSKIDLLIHTKLVNSEPIYYTKSMISSKIMNSLSINSVKSNNNVIKQTNYQSNYIIKSNNSFIIVNCQLKSALHSITIVCPNDETLVVSCFGNATIQYNITCPTTQTQPICHSNDLNNNNLINFNNLNDIIESYNPFETICINKFSFQTNNQQSLTQFVSTTVNYVTSDFKKRFETLKTINQSTITHNLIITITVSILLCLSIIGLYIFYNIDLLENNNITNNNNTIKLKRQQNIETYFDYLLPSEFSGQPWYTRFYYKLRFEHDWLCILLPHDPQRDYRSVRLLRAMSRILNFMFIDTIIGVSFEF